MAPPCARSSSLDAPFSACHVPTPLPKMVKLDVSFVLLTTYALLFQASLLAQYWVEGLHAATYLLNRLPTKTISTPIPYVALFGTAPSYEHLRVFGCACYPNMSATAPHSSSFLGYSSDHKGYRRLDLSTNCILISRHVVFDEADLPFSTSPHPTNDLDFLSSDDDLVVLHIGSPFIHRYPIVPGVA
jgi:hypothetical protein